MAQVVCNNDLYPFNCHDFHGVLYQIEWLSAEIDVAIEQAFGRVL